MCRTVSSFESLSFNSLQSESNSCSFFLLPVGSIISSSMSIFIPRQTVLVSSGCLKNEIYKIHIFIISDRLRLEFIVQCIFGTSLACLGLDVQVDEEETWKECSEKDGQVSTELNLQRKRSGRKSINDGVHGESRGGKSSNWHRCGGSLGKGLGNCNGEKRKI